MPGARLLGALGCRPDKGREPPGEPSLSFGAEGVGLGSGPGASEIVCGLSGYARVPLTPWESGERGFCLLSFWSLSASFSVERKQIMGSQAAAVSVTRGKTASLSSVCVWERHPLWSASLWRVFSAAKQDHSVECRFRLARI